MQTFLRRVAVARTMLTISAWSLVVILAIGFIVFSPDIIDAIAGRRPRVQILSYADLAPLLGIVSMVVVWLSAMWHAAVNEKRRRIPKISLLALLFVGNIPAALIYYFALVMWEPKV